MHIQVKCYAGYRGEQTPRRLILEQRQIDVAAVQDCWLAPDHRYFKLLGHDGGLYIVRHDTASDGWELTSYTVRPCPPAPPAARIDATRH